jgi:hypothetical protein
MLVDSQNNPDKFDTAFVREDVAGKSQNNSRPAQKRSRYTLARSMTLMFLESCKNFGSKRPGSNRRRPAWEFSIEFYVFFFCRENLVDIFRFSDLHRSFSNFN